MEADLRASTDLRIVSVGAGPSRRGGASLVFLNLERRRGMMGSIKSGIQLLLLGISLCMCIYGVLCLTSQTFETL